jgi:hypothetical protein
MGPTRIPNAIIRSMINSSLSLAFTCRAIPYEGEVVRPISTRIRVSRIKAA